MWLYLERIQFKLVLLYFTLLQIFQKIHFDKRISILIFIICFTVFVFTNDGHRYTFDEDVAYQQSYRIATWTNDPSYIQGESRPFFEYPYLFPHDLPIYQGRPLCENGILCSQASIIHSVTQAPFIFLNHTFNFILDDTVIWTTDDFHDVHYLSWRNSENPDFIYGSFRIYSFYNLPFIWNFSKKFYLCFIYLWF